MMNERSVKCAILERHEQGTNLLSDRLGKQLKNER